MKIAIQGHPFRGKEIIKILESLGGENDCPLTGTDKSCYYYIDVNDKKIRCHDIVYINSCKKYTLEKFEKEFPFKIGDLCIYSSDIIQDNIIIKILGMTISDNCIMYELGHKDTTNKHSFIYRKSNTLKLYKEMKEERNITLTIDKAKEWYKKGGDLKEVALQAFSEQELNPLPKSWEELCKQNNPTASWRYNIPIKYEALFKLEQLRDCWRQGWKPDYTKTYKKFRIKKLGTEYITDWSTGLSDFLVFQTEEIAKEFLEYFRDLIEQAGDLI